MHGGGRSNAYAWNQRTIGEGNPVYGAGAILIGLDFDQPGMEPVTIVVEGRRSAAACSTGWPGRRRRPGRRIDRLRPIDLGAAS